jgi:hypothetical protein
MMQIFLAKVAPKWARVRDATSFQLVSLAFFLACTPLRAESEDLPPNGRDAVLVVSPEMCKDMRERHVLNRGAPVSCERLRLVRFGYIGFDQQLHSDGQIMVLDAVADQVLAIFGTLRERRFPIASAQLMNKYNGDDDVSMSQNNTSAFNVRQIAGGGSLSLHAYGVAIDINPVQNPYLRRSITGLAVSPKSGADYVNRKIVRAGMAESILDVFAAHGFTIWGGHWRNPIDYQHFQVSQKLAYQLAAAPSQQAHATFEQYVTKYIACIQASSKKESDERACGNQ